jgi:sarcosine oxidase subunit beta
MSNYDVIIIGAGSIGVPAAMALGEKGVRTLVIDRNASPGQGENKHAIGGIRATHSSPGKILTALRSLEIFSHWEAETGESIEWLQGGYLFPVYRENEEAILTSILPIQKEYGLNIDYVNAERVKEVLPGIAGEGLLGGTFSPEDGSASPLLAIHAFYRRALASGVAFHFRETVEEIMTEQGKTMGIRTGQGRYLAPVVVDAAGPHSASLCRMAGIDLPVYPDSHEAAITEPVKNFFGCMVVDLRPGPGSKNFYFYQNRLGQVVFCITPDPALPGTDTKETSVFLPQVSARMVALLPRLKNLRVRRMWRGLYPMTPDGSPLVGWDRNLKGFLHATGMCGQGFMLGPGIGELVGRMIVNETTPDDQTTLEEFSPYREFGGTEALK